MLFRLDERTGHELPVDEITPLRLVQTAGRFGWTLLETHRRIARLQPLGLGLRYPVDACPNEIVSWQDLLLVTEHLDGQEPALSGRVGAAHIAAGAAEVDESVERVRTTLQQYSSLFSFSVDEEVG